MKRGSGEPEPFSPSVFAQEVAEVIGTMATQNTNIDGPKHKSQEAFIISLHGTLFYTTAAYFCPKYIKYIKTGKYARKDSGNRLWVRRSVQLDLKDPEKKKKKKIKALAVY